jgi:hypothetical protein
MVGKDIILLIWRWFAQGILECTTGEYVTTCGAELGQFCRPWHRDSMLAINHKHM